MNPALPLAVLLTASLLASQEDRTSDSRPSKASRIIADALVSSFAPRRDAPDETLRILLDAARKAGANPAAELLLIRARSLVVHVADPKRAQTANEALLAGELHGAVRQAAEFLHHQLLAKQGTDTQPPQPLRHYAKVFTVIGPLGDDGDHYLDTAFAPELSFPGPKTILDGRFGPVQSRKVVRSAESRLANLSQRGRNGCIYALHQVVTKAATPCLIEVGCSGSFAVFLNGECLLRLDRARQERRFAVHVPAVLRAGHNHVLVKSAETRGDKIALRYVDALQMPLTGLTEFAEAPVVRPFAQQSADLTAPSTPVEPAEQMARFATRPADPARKSLHALAAALASLLTQKSTLLFDMVQAIEAEHLTSPDARLALALALRSAGRMPREIRFAAARRIIADLGKDPQLASSHHTLVMAQARLLQEQDKREEAIRLLQGRVDEQRAGPEVFDRLYRLYASLRFTAAIPPLLREWQRAVPGDATPVMLQVRQLEQGHQRSVAHGLLQKARVRHPGDGALSQAALRFAAEAGDQAQVQALLSRMYRHRLNSLDYLYARARWSRYLGDREQSKALFKQVAEHAEASAHQLLQAGNALQHLGAEQDALIALRKSLALDQDQQDLRRRLGSLAGQPEFAKMATFRHDTKAIIDDFRFDAKREKTASSTVLLDQMIVQVLPNGAQVEEVHIIRRINDQQGVDSYKDARAVAAADEVIAVRTITADGQSFVPNRVARNFSLPRLAPGCFIEEHYRNYSDSDKPSPLRTSSFLLQSTDEPYLHSEFVVILPKDTPGSFRRRNLPKAAIVKSLADGDTAHIFVAKDVPRLRTETLTPPVDDLLPNVVYGEDGHLAAKLRLARHRLGPLYRVPQMVRNTARKLVRGEASDRGKLLKIHRFVQTTIEDGSRAGDPVQVLMTKKGSRYHLTRALLQEAAVPFRDAIFARTPHGLRREAAPPFAGESTYPVQGMLVTPKDGDPVWMFADLPRYYPLGNIPVVRQGASGRFVDDASPVLLPVSDSRGRTGQKVNGTITLLDKNKARFTLQTVIPGPQGFALAERFRNARKDMQDMAARQILSRTLSGWRVESAQLMHTDKPGKPLTIRGTLSNDSALRPSEDYLSMDLPLAPVRLLRSFGDRAERRLPMRLALRTGTEWSITIDPGQNYRLVRPPASVHRHHPVLAYDLQATIKQPLLHIRRSLVLREGTIAPQDFAAWRDLLQTIDRGERQPLRFKRR